MKTLTLTAILAMVITSVAPVCVQARLIVYEPFNYTWSQNNPDASLGFSGGRPYDNTGGNPTGSGTGLRSTWGSSVHVSNALTYSAAGKDLICSNYGAFETVNGWGSGSQYFYRDMTTDPYAAYRKSRNVLGVTGKELWFSFLLRTADAAQNARISITDQGSQNTYVGFNGTDGKLSINRTSGVQDNYGSVQGAADTTYLMVLKFVFGNQSNACSLWVNPTLGVTPSDPPDSFASSASGNTNAMDLFYVQTRTSAANIMQFDELRMGETYADVTPFVPEPALLGVLVLCGLLLRRA